MRRFRDHVAFYVVEHKFDTDVCYFTAELYNGSKSPIQVGRNLPELLKPENLAIRANGSETPIPLNESNVVTQSVTLTYDHVLSINFIVSTNLLPHSFSMNYRKSDGTLTNAVINVGSNGTGVIQ